MEKYLNAVASETPNSEKEFIVSMEQWMTKLKLIHKDKEKELEIKKKQLSQTTAPVPVGNQKLKKEIENEK